MPNPDQLILMNWVCYNICLYFLNRCLLPCSLFLQTSYVFLDSLFLHHCSLPNSIVIMSPFTWLSVGIWLMPCCHKRFHNGKRSHCWGILSENDGTTVVDGGLKIPVEDPSVRAEGDNRKVEGGNQRLYSKLFKVRITNPLSAGVTSYSQGYVHMS